MLERARGAARTSMVTCGKSLAIARGGRDDRFGSRLGRALAEERGGGVANGVYASHFMYIGLTLVHFDIILLQRQLKKL
jgi:hypothetical protein